MDARERVRFPITTAGTIRQRVAEPAEEQRPAGLAWIEPASRAEVREVFVISPYKKRLLAAFKPVPPLLKSQNHRQQLTVAHIIISS